MICSICLSASIGWAQQCDPIGAFYGADSVINIRFHSDIAAGDLNQDGYPDLLVPGFRRVYFNDGTGRLGSGVSLGSVGSHDPHLVDLDDDGDLDLVVRDGAFIKVLSNPGSGMLAFESSFELVPSCIEVFDFNADGSPDIIWASGSQVGVLVNDGVGMFTALDLGSSDFEGGAELIRIADLDGDLVPEIVLTSERLIRIYRADAVGNYSRIQRINIGLDFGAEHIQTLLLEDLNGDGLPELAFTCFSIVPSDLDFVTVYRNRGDATFVPRDNHPMFNIPIDLHALDIDLDGITDLLVSEQNTDSIWVMRGDGTARFEPIGPINTFGSAPLSSPRQIISPDLNLDGMPDLVIGNYNASSVSYAFNRCGSHPCPPDLTGEGVLDAEDVEEFIDAYFSGNPAVDFDQDGRLTFRDVSQFLVAYKVGCP